MKRQRVGIELKTTNHNLFIIMNWNSGIHTECEVNTLHYERLASLKILNLKNLI